jgi:hypothetical protein
MTVDEQLRQTLDTLAVRLKDEIGTHLSAAIADLSASIEADRARAVADATNEVRIAAEEEFAVSRTAAVSAAETRLRVELTASIEADRARAVADATNEARIAAEEEFAARREAAVSAAETRLRAELSASIEADRARAVADATNEVRIAAEQAFAATRASAVSAAETGARADAEAAEMEANARLLDAFAAIDRARSLSDILDVLVASTGAEAARAALFLPEGSLLRGWRQIGFETLDKDGADFSLAASSGGLIADAMEAGRAVRAGEVTSSAGWRSVAPAFAELPADRPALAVPLVMSGQTFAILYADQSRNAVAGRQSWPYTVEVLARHAARSLEAVTATRLAQVGEMTTQS